MTEPRVVDPAVGPDDDADAEVSLRPRRIGDFVGQPRLREQLGIALEASRRRHEPLDHVLLSGPPGLGKTTLASIIAAELNVTMRPTSGPAIEHQGMLASILTGLGDGEVLFIDEIHRLARPVEEALYPAMEDFVFDYVAGRGAGAQTLQLRLPRFTLVGATTRAGAISAPLRDRFGITHRLEFYGTEELTSIVHRSAGILGVRLDAGGAAVIAGCSRGTPRVSNRLLRRARDFAEVRGSGVVDAPTARRALDTLGIDDDGLDDMDRRVLGVLCNAYAGRPVGLNTIAVSVSEDPETIEDVVEPYLIRLGLLARTPAGRIATRGAYEHLELAPPAGVPGSSSWRGEEGDPEQTVLPGTR